jgi:hypothetical protein
LDNSDIFKELLTENKISYEITTSKISNREHIRVEFTREKLETLTGLIQKNIKERNWVEILGEENMLIFKDSIEKNFLADQKKWFNKLSEWEPFLQDQVDFWHLLSKNEFLSPLLRYTSDGFLINSSEYDGLTSAEARRLFSEKAEIE